MPDTSELQRHFGQPTEQKPGCGFPVAHLLALFDACTGMLIDVLASSWRIHDLTRVSELHPRLQIGDLLVADRGFCSYAHLALLQQQGIQAVLRVHQRRRVSFKVNRYYWGNMAWPKRLGHNDQLTLWHKTSVASRVMSREAYEALPEMLVVRELRYRVHSRGYRTREVTLVTTLLDPEQYPSAALAELYHRRWQAEVNLRHLKDTLGMRVLRSQTEAGVERELLAFALVYNLVCAVMTVVAVHLETTPERISLMDVLRLLRHGLNRLIVAAIVVNPDRPGRVQPRCGQTPTVTILPHDQAASSLEAAVDENRRPLTEWRSILTPFRVPTCRLHRASPPPQERFPCRPANCAAPLLLR